MSIKVNLPNHGTFWLMTADATITDQTHGAIAPLSHCDEEGHLKDLATAMFLNGPSYAHLYTDGTIHRYDTVIGHRNDLSPVEE